LAAVPSIGRATRVEGATPIEADLTRALYETYANQIFRYCLHQLGSREEAEDAVQSTFLNAFRGLKRGVVPELESAWLFKIAHNVCLSRRRSSWRRGRVESPADFEAIEELAPAPSRGADELIGLQDVLEQMPESQRRAILLREWQGLSYREISAELELSQGAVETLIFRARRALAAGLEEPPEPTKRRLLRGADLGSLLAGLKALLVGGSGAAKIAAVVAVASATTVVAADPVVQRQHHSHGTQPGHTVAPAKPPQPSLAPRGEVASAVTPEGGVRVWPTPERSPQRVGHQAVSRAASRAASAPGQLAFAAAAAKKQHPVATARSANAHAKPSVRPAIAPGAKGVHRAVAKGHAVRTPQRHTTLRQNTQRHTGAKGRPSAPAPAAGTPVQQQTAPHGAGKTKALTDG